jgi:hypothetical protein
MRDFKPANERGLRVEEGVKDVTVVDVAEAVENGGLIAGLPDDEVADGVSFFMEDRVGGAGSMRDVVL